MLGAILGDIAGCIYLAREGKSKAEIKAWVEERFPYYNLNRTVDEIRPDYEFDETCQGSVPEAIVCFLESTDFEDALKTAISIGGDSDTIADMTGAIAEAFYGIPDETKIKGLEFLNEDLLAVVNEFYTRIHK